jgi:hypothetical protein
MQYAYRIEKSFVMAKRFITFVAGHGMSLRQVRSVLLCLVHFELSHPKAGGSETNDVRA